MFPMHSAKDPSIRSTLIVSSSTFWRLVILLTLVSCWGTLGTLYYVFVFVSWNPLQQQQQQQPKPNQAEGVVTPAVRDPNMTPLPWIPSWWLSLRSKNGRQAEEPTRIDVAPSSCGGDVTHTMPGSPSVAVERTPTTINGPAVKPTTDNPSAVSRTKAAEEDEMPLSKSDEPSTLLVQYGDSIYLRGDWDGAPVVVEKYRLVFFTVPKVGCTAFKQLMRRMMGHRDWNVEEYNRMLPWNPSTNGLKYLYDYSPQQASEMMTSNNWTKAIFVREPKSRLLSAYLDKAFHQTYLREKCCSYTGSCVAPARASLDGFLTHIVHFCDNAHWRPQHKRMEDKYWQYVNFVGHMETIQDDSKRLLEHIGAWKQHGASGWGPFRNGTLFGESSSTNGGQKHATDAAAKLRKYYSDPNLIRAVESYYAQDYANPHLNITRAAL